MQRIYIIICFILLNNCVAAVSRQWNNGIIRIEATDNHICYIKTINNFTEIWHRDGDRFWKAFKHGNSPEFYCNIPLDQVKKEFYTQEKRFKTRYISRDQLKKILYG